MSIGGVILRWGWVSAWRSFVYDFLRTAQGKVCIVVFALSVPALIDLLRKGGFRLSQMSEAELQGTLTFIHLVLPITFAISFLLRVWKVFLVKPEHVALRNFPFALRETALFVLLVSGFSVSYLFVLASFYVFFSRLLFRNFAVSWLMAHFALLSGELFVVAILVGVGVRHWLKVSGPRRRSVGLIQRIGYIAWVLSYILWLLGPALLKDSAPEVLARIGSDEAQHWDVLQPPLSLLRAVSTGEWSRAVVSMTILVLVTALSVWLLVRWYRVAHREIILDEGGILAPVYSSAFAPGRRRTPFAVGSVSGAFWVKDVLLPIRRSAAGYAQQLAFTLSGSVIAVVFLHFWEESRTTGTGVTCFILVLATLAVPLIFSAHGCLPILGMEGVNIALLRPVLGIRRLLFAKSSAQALFVLGHTVALATLIGLGAKLTGLAHPGILVAWGLALAGTVAFSAMGLALGFGLPDFQRKSMAAPGASKPAQFIHMAGGGLVAVTWSLIATAFTLGHITVVALAVGVIVSLVFVLTLSAVIGVWSLRHLERLEI